MGLCAQSPHAQHDMRGGCHWLCIVRRQQCLAVIMREISRGIREQGGQKKV